MSGPTLGNPVDTGDDSTTRTTPPRSHLSDMEPGLYYYGLHFEPRLVARTGSTLWETPTDPEARPQPKELRIAASH